MKFAEQEFKAGKSKEEAMKATVIPGAEEWQSGRIGRAIGAAYEEVEGR